MWGEMVVRMSLHLRGEISKVGEIQKVGEIVFGRLLKLGRDVFGASRLYSSPGAIVVNEIILNSGNSFKRSSMGSRLVSTKW